MVPMPLPPSTLRQVSGSNSSSWTTDGLLEAANVGGELRTDCTEAR